MGKKEICNLADSLFRYFGRFTLVHCNRICPSENCSVIVICRPKLKSQRDIFVCVSVHLIPAAAAVLYQFISKVQFHIFVNVETNSGILELSHFESNSV